MKNIFLGVLFAGIMILFFISCPRAGVAEVNINIGVNVGPPPPVVIPAPPPVIVIPGTYVYFAPDIQVDILFYHGYWYRPYEGGWYRATAYNGRWVHIVGANVPQVLYHLPSNYRAMSGYSYRHIPYHDLSRNWRAWERGNMELHLRSEDISLGAPRITSC